MYCGKNKSGKITSSKLEVVKKGVPQGSILGPLLYILYTNELPEVTKLPTVQFADDTTIIFNMNKTENISAEIFDKLEVLEKWFTANNLSLNISKTKLMQFSYDAHHDEEIYWNNEKTKHLETTGSASFQGITLDSRLDWKQHVETVSKSIAKCCYALKIVSSNIGIPAAINAYHAYVHSKIRYGVIFWGTVLKLIELHYYKNAVYEVFLI